MSLSLAFRFYLSIAFACWLSVSSYSQNRPQAELKVSADAPFNRYSPQIFGQFIEHFHRQVYGGIFEPGSRLSDKQGFRTDVMQALREMKVPVVRWPGGCFVSSYHWLKGVGQKRTPAYDKAWHVEDPNTFGTDEYIDWCRKIGAEPFICTNAGTGTPEEMSDWVEYCNLSVGEYGRMRVANGRSGANDVKYWSIGNENYGPWEIGAKTVDEWGYLVRESAKMTLSVDQSIKLFAAALADDKWTVPLLERAGPYLSYVSIHGYWDFMVENNTPSDFTTCMLRTVKPEEQIQNTINILKKTGFDTKIKIAFDEWNLRNWHHPGHGQHLKGMDVKARDKNDINSIYTMADALFSACFFKFLPAPFGVRSDGLHGPAVNTRGPLYVYPGGLVKRTTYHVMSLYANQLQPNVLQSSIQSTQLTDGKTSVPMVDGIITCSDDKKQLAIALVNKSATQNIDCSLGLTGVDGLVDAIVSSGDSPDAFNDVQMPDRVVPASVKLTVVNGRVTLPKHSLTILKVSR